MVSAPPLLPPPSKMTVDICNLTRRTTPRLPFEAIATVALPKGYELSVVFCGSTLSRRLNRERRTKEKAANVLSFPLTKTAGEIFIDLAVAEREAKRDGISLTERVGILFIHGSCHLAGYDHGRTMERQEEKLMNQFFFLNQK